MHKDGGTRRFGLLNLNDAAQRVKSINCAHKDIAI